MPSIYALFIFNWGFSIIILSHALQSVFILLYLPCLKSFSLAFFFLLVFCRNPSQTSFSEKVKTSSKWWYHVSKVIHCCPGCARWDSLTSLYLWCSDLERTQSIVPAISQPPSSLSIWYRPWIPSWAWPLWLSAFDLWFSTLFVLLSIFKHRNLF